MNNLTKTSSPITIYASHTCEDTAITLDRLNALGVNAVTRWKEDEADVVRILEKYNHGQGRTPTVVFGLDEMVLIEPTIDELEAALLHAGYEIKPPSAIEFNSALASRLVPWFELPTTDGDKVSPANLRGRQRTVLFFAHDELCLVCQGYAKQLAAHRVAFAEFEARPLFVLQANGDCAKHWAEEFARGVTVLADAEGKVMHAFADYFAVAHKGVMLLILDKFAAPRQGLFAPDAGGLLSQREIEAWLRVLDCECSE
ncbi:MAG TPA: redoxin domain-containing protein [Anaerolineae bacterium]